jgi:hypothetical protein
MSIEQTDVVDFVTIEHGSGRVLLTISDHLKWDENEGEHLLMLQEKLNAYLRFIESGEMEERVPETHGRQVAINVVAKYSLSTEASKFFDLAKNVIEKAGFALEFKVLSE